MGHDLGHAALALLATTVYYIAFLVFRISARRMERCAAAARSASPASC